MSRYIVYLTFDSSAAGADLWQEAAKQAKDQTREGSGLITVNGESLTYSRDRGMFSRVFYLEEVMRIWMINFELAYPCWTAQFVEFSHDEIPVDSPVTPYLGIYESNPRYQGCTALVSTKIKGVHTVSIVILAPPGLYRQYLSDILRHDVKPKFWHQPVPGSTPAT